MFLVVGDVLARGIGFFSTVYLARVLGPEGFGVVIIGLSVLTYTMWLSDMGLSTMGAREIARPQAQRQYRLMDFLIARISLAAVATLLSAICVHVLFANSVHVWTISAFTFGSIMAATGLEWYFQGYEDAGLIAISRILFAVIYLTAVTVVVTQEDDVRFVPWCYASALLFGGAILYMWKKPEDAIWSRPKLAVSARLIAQSSRIGIGSLFGQIVQSLPPLVVGVLLSESHAGAFGAASKVVFFVLVVDRVFGVLFLPAVTRLFSTNAPNLAARLDAILKYVIAAGVCATVCLMPASEWLIRFIFSNRFADSVPLLMIMLWFVPLTLLNSYFGFGLIAVGKELRYRRVMILAGVLTAVLIVVLTLFLGTVGACFGMIAGELLSVLMMQIEFKKTFQSHFWIHTVRPVLFGVLLLTISRWFDHGILSSLFNALLFVLLFGLSGGLRRRDWLNISGRPA